MRVRLAGTLNAFGYFGYATASAYGGQHFVFGTPRYRQCKMISHSAKSGPGLIDSHQHMMGAEMQPPPPAISEQAASGFADQGEKSLLFTF